MIWYKDGHHRCVPIVKSTEDVARPSRSRRESQNTKPDNVRFRPDILQLIVMAALRTI